MWHVLQVTGDSANVLCTFSSELAAKQAKDKYWPGLCDVVVIAHKDVYATLEEWEAAKRFETIVSKLEPGEFDLLKEHVRRMDATAAAAAAAARADELAAAHRDYITKRYNQVSQSGLERRSYPN